MSAPEAPRLTAPRWPLYGLCTGCAPHQVDQACPALARLGMQAGQLLVAEALFHSAAMPDAITFEAFIAACGIAGVPDKVGTAAGLHTGSWAPQPGYRLRCRPCKLCCCVLPFGWPSDAKLYSC